MESGSRSDEIEKVVKIHFNRGMTENKINIVSPVECANTASICIMLIKVVSYSFSLHYQPVY